MAVTKKADSFKSIISVNILKIFGDIKLSREYLDQLLEKFLDKYDFDLNIGIEIEFFLISENPDELIIHNEKLIAEMSQELKKYASLISGFIEEEGRNQFEVILSATPDIILVVDQVIKVRKVVAMVAKKYGVKASFNAKPYEDDMANGLHINLSLSSRKDQHNLYLKDQSKLFSYSIGGLLETMNRYMIIFAPKDGDYKRFNAKVNVDDVVHNSHSYANSPVNVSWGINNRTTAIRVPSFLHNDPTKHIEHRVAAADSNPYLVVAAIIAGIDEGIMRQIEAGKPIYGNAFDEQYDYLKPFPHDRKKAIEMFLAYYT